MQRKLTFGPLGLVMHQSCGCPGQAVWARRLSPALSHEGLIALGRGGGATGVVAFEAVRVALDVDDLGVVTRRPIMAAATVSSPKTSPQRLRGLFDVTMTEARS
jgi:hypothetical protein